MTKEFWKAALIRAIKTVCQTAVATIGTAVVITDVNFRPGQTGVAILRRGMQEPEYLFHKRFDGLFHGTGDVFASFLLGALMNDQPLETAAQTALDMTHAAIWETVQGGEHLRYGVQIERVLPQVLERIR